MAGSRTYVLLAALSLVVCVLAGIASRLKFPGPLPHHFAHVDLQLKDEKAALQRFARTLSFRTISLWPEERDADEIFPNEMRQMHQHFRSSWPEVFSRLEVTQVSKFSLLLKWQGSDTEKRPALFISHQDVVDAGPENRWTHSPFSGAIADGYVWGRGSLDVKVTLTAMLEAVDHLLSQRYQPQRTLYFAFGEDEEVGGLQGAAKIADGLRRQGVKLEFIMDEGGTVLRDGLKGITDIPVAVVATAEKTQINIEATINGTGGHAMTPPSSEESAVSKLARFIAKLEADQTGPRMVPPVPQMLQALAHGASSKLLRIMLHNADHWLLSRLLARVLHHMRGEMRALVLTSHIVNGIMASPSGRNVVPSQVKLNINFRNLPGTDEEELLRKVRSALHASCGETGVIERTWGIMPMGKDVASLENAGFHFLRQAAHEILEGPKGLIVAPYLMLGRTDSSHYMDICGGNVYRFMPFHMNKTAGDVQRVHGIDERVGVQDYLRGIKFYIRMLQLSSS